jgi:phosphoribosylformylglycinamidine cyclo-ligase
MSQYAKSGVNIAAKMAIIDRIKGAVHSTHGPAVLAGVGAFGGLFAASGPGWPDDAVLVGSTDGIGTKTMLAAQAGRYRGLGQDIVNHCINDILCQGARPLFFMDYVASSHLEPNLIADIIEGMAQACSAAGCALLGGETAEMPGVYAPGHFDVVGTIIGVVSKQDLLPLPTIQPGDVLFALPSSGPHTNGYSLIRRIFREITLDTDYEEIGAIGDALLAPHRSYLDVITRLRQAVPIKGLAHITGGGFYDNIPRVLPEGTGVEIERRSWNVPALFHLIQELGQVNEAEMYHVYNMGVGMIIVVSPEAAKSIQPADYGMYPQPVGRVVEGKGVQLI